MIERFDNASDRDSGRVTTVDAQQPDTELLQQLQDYTLFAEEYAGTQTGTDFANAAARLRRQLGLDVGISQDE